MSKQILDYNALHEVLIEKEKPKLGHMNNFDIIMANNKRWAAKKVSEDPNYFKKLVSTQEPQYLWIGCSDSRVPANQVLGLKPGELFVHRNVANIVSTSDINCLAVIQYAVEVLNVKDIIVCGHYNCGGCQAAFSKLDHGPLEAWLSHIRDIRYRFKNQLIFGQEQNKNIFVELNVKQQVYNVAKIPIVQKAWKMNKQLRIHGLVYILQNGTLKDLGITLSKLSQVKPEFQIFNV